MTLESPYAWFGGKRNAVEITWRAFGDVKTYIEPFFGGGSMLLGNPYITLPRYEIINDFDCFVANFWRSLQADPDAVARFACRPVVEADLRAWNRELIARAVPLRAAIIDDPRACDLEVAGRWVWGMSVAIAGNFARREVMNAKPCIHSKGVIGKQRDVRQWMRELAARLANTKVLCGDWSRVVTGSYMGTAYAGGNGMLPCGVFLDPPYDDEGRDAECYREDTKGISAAVREWAMANGDHPYLRIALCGYEGEHAMPASWTCHAWKAHGGYGNNNAENLNATRERIWFSPHCLPLVDKQVSIFDVLERTA